MSRRFRNPAALLAVAMVLAGCQAAKTGVPHGPVAAPSDSAPAGPPPPAAAQAPSPVEPANPAGTTAPTSAPPASTLARLRAALAEDSCDPKDGRTAGWIRQYSRNPLAQASHIESVLPLFDYVLTRMQAAGLPAEFALLPMVESDYRPDVRSSAGPAGMWQFTAPTARGHGLGVRSRLDERLSPAAATAAAIKLLTRLHQRFGDWRLVVMAFNAGEYRVARALDAHGADPAGLPGGLSPITYDHLAKLRAWTCLLSEPARYGLQLDDRPLADPLETAEVPAFIATTAQLAEAAGIDVDELRRTNPLLSTATALPGRRFILPRSAAHRLRTHVEGVARGAIAAPPVREHVVRSGDTLSAIGDRHGVSVRQLQQWNALGRSTLLSIGQRLRLQP